MSTASGSIEDDDILSKKSKSTTPKDVDDLERSNSKSDFAPHHQASPPNNKGEGKSKSCLKQNNKMSLKSSSWGKNNSSSLNEVVKNNSSSFEGNLNGPTATTATSIMKPAAVSLETDSACDIKNSSFPDDKWGSAEHAMTKTVNAWGKGQRQADGWGANETSVQ